MSWQCDAPALWRPCVRSAGIGEGVARALSAAEAALGRRRSVLLAPQCLQKALRSRTVWCVSFVVSFSSVRCHDKLHSSGCEVQHAKVKKATEVGCS